MSKMRKTLATFVLMALLFVAIPLAANAQSRCRTRSRRSYATRSYRSYAPARYNRNYYNNGYYVERQRPSFYRRHRNLINLGIATGAGAGIGALLGGNGRRGRGALIGAGAGAGLGALYTYVLKAKKRRY